MSTTTTMTDRSNGSTSTSGRNEFYERAIVTVVHTLARAREGALAPIPPRDHVSDFRL